MISISMFDLRDRRGIYSLSLSLLTTLFLLPFNSYAENIGSSTEEQRSQCFEILKENMAEAGVFELPLETLNNMAYKDLKSKLSKDYGVLSFAGISIDEKKISLRHYGFGRLSGYVYPPKIPLPVFTKADMWEKPASEFTIAEEFVIDSEGKKYFIGCLFSSMDAEDLLSIKEDNYLHDIDGISLLKTANDMSYKAWYGESIGVGYDSRPILKWRSLFIYPKFTKNEYFNKYDVIDSFSSNKIESFGILNFFLQDLIQLYDYDESNRLIDTKYMAVDNNGDFNGVFIPKELIPMKPEGLNEIFPFTEYYQAIEGKFPEFAEFLSIMGTLKYSTYKKLVADKLAGKIDERSDKLLDTISDYRSLTNYVRNKEDFEREGIILSDPEKDEFLSLVQNADVVIKKIEKEKKMATLKKFGKASLVGFGFIAFAYSTFLFIRKRIIKIG